MRDANFHNRIQKRLKLIHQLNSSEVEHNDDFYELDNSDKNRNLNPKKTHENDKKIEISKAEVIKGLRVGLTAEAIKLKKMKKMRDNTRPERHLTEKELIKQRMRQREKQRERSR